MLFCINVNLFTYVLQKMKKSNPGVSFADASREIADKWRGMSGMCFMSLQILSSVVFFWLTRILVECLNHRLQLFLLAAEEKEPYEAKAQADKKRYKDELSDYKNTQPMQVDSEKGYDSN